MNNKNQSTFIKIAFWTVLTVITMVGAFFIVYNAQWLIGDDYELIRHTGSGVPFLPSGTVKPHIGRFFPTAYLIYDVLLLFNHGGGYLSPAAHYLIHAICFVIFVAAVTMMSFQILKCQSVFYRYFISLCFVVFNIELAYPYFLQCASTIWLNYTMVVLIVVFCYYFKYKQKWIYAICALFCVNYYCYELESNFVLPLAMGVLPLLLMRKNLSRRERVFHWLMIGSALLYLLLYAVLILPNVEKAYDGSHGAELGIVGNAITMLREQKMLLFVAVVIIVRAVDMIKNKKEFMFFDNLLFTAAACCCGCFVLRLNWGLYYVGAVLLSMSAILYFSIHYLKERWSGMVFAFLVIMSARGVRLEVKHNQRHRKGTYAQVCNLSHMLDEVDGSFWYAPAPDEDSFDVVIRDWKYKTICAYLAWMRQEPDFSIQIAPAFQCLDNTLWLNDLQNSVLFPDDKVLQENGVEVFSAGGIQGYMVSQYE